MESTGLRLCRTRSIKSVCGILEDIAAWEAGSSWLPAIICVRRSTPTTRRRTYNNALEPTCYRTGLSETLCRKGNMPVESGPAENGNSESTGNRFVQIAWIWVLFSIPLTWFVGSLSVRNHSAEYLGITVFAVVCASLFLADKCAAHVGRKQQVLIAICGVVAPLGTVVALLAPRLIEAFGG